MSKKIALFSKGLTEKTTAALLRVIDALHTRGVNTYLNIMEPSGNRFESDPRVSVFHEVSELPGDTSLIISVGGDGTFLETARRIHNQDIPVAGINTGRLGFLANIPDDDIGRSIDLLCADDYEVVSRTMLEIISPENLFGSGNSLALNEVTVQRADQTMISIMVKVNGTILNTYRADGLIISTATGSTAYNLSVGGPILSPSDESIIIAPISPHNLTIRPIITGSGSTVTMVMEGRSDDCFLTCDSRAVRVPLGTTIEIRQAAFSLRTVTTAGNDFFSTLRNKLMWGADLRN